jgi:hypothetical protein
MAGASKPQSADEKKASATARLWIAEVEASEKWGADYLKRAKRIVQRFKNDVFYVDQTLAPEQRRYAILWSNVQTLGPAIYARTPSPVVSRRFRDPDPVGKLAAEVLERAVSFSLDQYDFDERMNLSRDNYLLVGRGQVWARYVPHVATGRPLQPEVAPNQDAEVQVTDSQTGEGAADTVTYQEVLCDYVPYSDWGYGACRSWDETPFVWRRVYMTRVELVKRFGKDIGKAVPLDWAPKDDPNFEGDTDERSRVKKAAIYEIWDKGTGQVYWINKSYPAGPLDQRDDPLDLTDFFPCPRPLMSTTPPDEYIPIPDYVFYQDQAEELDELTQRIGTLTDALRMVGIYAAEDGNILATMFQGKQNQLIPVPSMASLQDKGGLKGIIEWLPVDMVMTTLKGCFESRKQILDDIYQITGISDILRGDSQPSETATAQGIKAQWGSLRVRDRQKDVQRFARDVIRLKAEIIGKHFTVDTLKAMTGVKLMTAAEKQQVMLAQQQFQQQTQLWQQGAQIAQQQGLPPQPQPQPPPILQTPDLQDLMSKPSWDDVNGVLKDNAMRSFKVDVETDSTIEPNENEEKQRRVEFITAIGQFMAAAMPLVQQVPALAPMVGESVKFLARGFRVSGEMEDVIEKTFEQLQAMAPQPPKGQGQQQQKTSPEELQLKQQELQGKQAESQAKIQQAQAAHQLEAQSLQIQADESAHQQQIDMADLHLRAGDQQLAAGDQQLKKFALMRDPKPQGTA